MVPCSTAPGASAATGGPAATDATGLDATPRRGLKRSAGDAGLSRDQYAELFGRIDPRHIPESASWFHGQQKNLMAISTDHELGLPTSMVTLTQNDNSPELLAYAPRGPC